MEISNKRIWPTLLASAIAAEFGIHHADAATILVDNQNCLLNDAIQAANKDAVSGGCIAGDGDDVIELPENSLITLDSTLTTINSHITINANGSTIHRQEGAFNDPIFYANGGRFVLNDATISNGLSIRGGGIRCRPITSESGCKIYRSSFINNNAYNSGGAVYFFSTENLMTEHAIIDSNFSGNSASSGGAIYLYSSYNTSAVMISNSTFEGNSATNPWRSNFYVWKLYR